MENILKDTSLLTKAAIKALLTESGIPEEKHEKFLEDLNTLLNMDVKYGK